MSYIEINELLMRLHLIPRESESKSGTTNPGSSDECCTDPDEKIQSSQSMGGTFNALQSGSIPSVKSTKR